MNKNLKVAVLVGSLRKASLNRKLAHALKEYTPESLQLEIVEIGALPLYNEDLETDSPPEPWKEFRAAIRAADALLFVTPEYNRSIPGALKNAIDVGSRPYGKAVWNRKPAAIISLSQGAISGFGANHHLRQTFVFNDILALAQPEAYIGNAGKLFDDAGKVAREDTRELLRKFMAAFEKWIEQLSR